MTKKYERIFCDKEFKKMMKTKAIQKGVSTIKFTELMAKNPQIILSNEPSENEKQIIINKKEKGGRLFDSLF